MTTTMTDTRRVGGQVLLAAPRGFCAGVERAVSTVEQLLEHQAAPVYVRGQIVHNRYVVTALEERGAVFVREINEIPEGATVVFSAHGVAPTVRAAADARGLAAVDATCPLVTKVHREVHRFVAVGYDVILIGEPGHDEIVGVQGEAPEHVHVIAGPDDVARTEVRDPDRVVWLSQTTLAVDEVSTTVAALRQRFPRLIDPPSDDICYAAQNRQAGAQRLARECDLVLVVGSANSHNSGRLVDVARAAGAPAAHLIDGPEQVDEAWLSGVHTVGVTAGASAPHSSIDALLGWLSIRGYDHVVAMPVAHEGQLFALPFEVQRRRSQSAAVDVTATASA